MISVFQRQVSVPSGHRQLHIEERLTLIIDFYHLLLQLFSSEALISEPIRSMPFCLADKHARYISEIYCLSRRSREGHEWTSAIIAHIVASITVFVTHRHYISAPRRYAIANARIAPMPCSATREWRPTGHVFLASSCLTPNKGICSI